MSLSRGDSRTKEPAEVFFLRRGSPRTRRGRRIPGRALVDPAKPQVRAHALGGFETSATETTARHRPFSSGECYLPNASDMPKRLSSIYVDFRLDYIYIHTQHTYIELDEPRQKRKADLTESDL